MIALAVSIFASTQSAAYTAGNALEICNTLVMSELPKDALVTMPWLARIGFIYEERPGNEITSDGILVVGSAIRMSHTHILTTSHTFKYRGAVKYHRVMFGCTDAVKTEEDARKQLRIFSVSDDQMTASPKEYLDYALLAIAQEYPETLEETGSVAVSAEEHLCLPKTDTRVYVAGYAAKNLKDDIKDPIRLALVDRGNLRDLRSVHFVKTAGTMRLIDYKALNIHDGFSGGAVFTSEGCLIGMHQRRLSKVRDITFTAWDPYVSLYYPHCRKSGMKDGGRSDRMDDNCLPGQSIWLGDIAVDAKQKRGAALFRDAPPLHYLANYVLRQRNYSYGLASFSGTQAVNTVGTDSPPSRGQPQGATSNATNSPASTGQPPGVDGGDSSSSPPSSGQPAGTN